MKSIIRRLLERFRPSKKRKPVRYSQLVDIISEHASRKIMEIGAHHGDRALAMINASIVAGNRPEEVEYYGFDLFEMMTKEIQNLDPSAKANPALSTSAIRSKLASTGAKVDLYKGFSTDTLPKVVGSLPVMDLIFIDGSHLISDIRKDWEESQKLMGENTIVVFDDYWEDGFNGDFSIGCNEVINSIDRNAFSVEIMTKQDCIQREWGILKINFVKVARIPQTKFA